MVFHIGTSGYSFADWLGTFYPHGTRQQDMFPYYVQHFNTVELNFTFYRMPQARTLARMADLTPEGFQFWVKANQKITHEFQLELCGEFLANLKPLREVNKLAGVLVQFAQSFHRTPEHRRQLGVVVGALAEVPLAVEFRHRSWDHPSTHESLAERDISLAVPDVPPLPDLYPGHTAVTTHTGYVRLHSRNANNWYAGGEARYDYNYTHAELQQLASDWQAHEPEVDRVYAFFNNCCRGQAAHNALAFRRLVDQVTGGSAEGPATPG